MTLSVNTNIGAQIALRNLSQTNTEMAATQKHISTGLKVSDAYDDGAAYAVSSSLRSDISVLGAVNERLNYGQGLIDVTVKAGESMQTTMKTLGETITKLADDNTTGDARLNYEAQYKSLTDELTTYIKAANYNGSSLMSDGNGGPSSNVNIIASTDGSTITVKQHDLTTDVLAQLTGVAQSDPPDGSSTSTDMQAMLAPDGAFTAAMSALGKAMNDWGNTSKTIGDKINFNNAMVDANTTGLGAIADADMAKESAKLQSLQVKQQLGTQSLSMANQAPQSIMSLFRG